MYNTGTLTFFGWISRQTTRPLKALALCGTSFPSGLLHRCAVVTWMRPVKYQCQAYPFPTRNVTMLSIELQGPYPSTCVVRHWVELLSSATGSLVMLLLITRTLRSKDMLHHVEPSPISIAYILGQLYGLLQPVGSALIMCPVSYLNRDAKDGR
ncbi:hypothetical protein BDN67DRAFT_777944 [Paxillus ammoniavirescens]|nr:hypothetical protein BDN67DRAFT_777944 [Paxillus ammoniavirescens]